MSEKRVRIFFYGTIMDPRVLREYGIVSEVEPAKLNGYKLLIRPRVNLMEQQGSATFGSVALLTHSEISTIYNDIEQQFGLRYFPEAVFAELLNGTFRSALCYIAPPMQDADPADGYISQLVESIRAVGLPEWYAAYVETFRVVSS
jgi:hypothetical protein